MKPNYFVEYFDEHDEVYISNCFLLDEAKEKAIDLSNIYDSASIFDLENCRLVARYAHGIKVK